MNNNEIDKTTRAKLDTRDARRYMHRFFISQIGTKRHQHTRVLKLVVKDNQSLTIHLRITRPSRARHFRRIVSPGYYEPLSKLLQHYLRCYILYIKDIKTLEVGYVKRYLFKNVKEIYKEDCTGNI